MEHPPSAVQCFVVSYVHMYILRICTERSSRPGASPLIPQHGDIEISKRKRRVLSPACLCTYNVFARASFLTANNELKFRFPTWAFQHWICAYMVLCTGLRKELNVYVLAGGRGETIPVMMCSLFRPLKHLKERARSCLFLRGLPCNYRTCRCNYTASDHTYVHVWSIWISPSLVWRTRDRL